MAQRTCVGDRSYFLTLIGEDTLLELIFMASCMQQRQSQMAFLTVTEIKWFGLKIIIILACKFSMFWDGMSPISSHICVSTYMCQHTYNPEMKNYHFFRDFSYPNPPINKQHPPNCKDAWLTQALRTLVLIPRSVPDLPMQSRIPVGSNSREYWLPFILEDSNQELMRLGL